jgi:hypothetical protein
MGAAHKITNKNDKICTNQSAFRSKSSLQENIRAKFKLSYAMNSETKTEVGEIDSIPVK